MPTLPTVTVTDAQYQRLLAVFVDGPTYKTWLKQQLINAVTTAEVNAMREQQRVAEENKRAEVAADLGTAT